MSEPLSTQACIKSTDMDSEMQQKAVDTCHAAYERFDDNREIAKYLKNKFDELYGGVWQCVVGMYYGCYVSHKEKHFIYFHLNSNAIMLYQADEKV